MYRVEIEGLCKGSKAPTFEHLKDAIHCFYSACDFLFTHDYHDSEVWLLDDDLGVYMWCIVTPDGVQKA